MNRAARESGVMRVLGWLPLALAIGVGTWLRWQQWADQVLIDDEWHLVHRLVLSTPREMFFDFGYSDYAIPLGLLYSVIGDLSGGISEVTLRLPMLVCGIATLAVLPALVWRRVGAQAATLFACLLAISPLLIVYSRLARPYALVVLLVWVAAFALARAIEGDRRSVAAGVVGVIASVLAAWLHLATACFIAGVFVVEAWTLLRAQVPRDRRRFARLAGLGLAIALASAALILPPLLANPQSMALKSGLDSPGADTMVAAWFAWIGTTSPWIAGAALVLALAGGGPLLRAVRPARALALGSVLALALVVATRPASSNYGIVLARYLLPALPLVLLAVAVGAVRLVRAALAYVPRVAPVVAGAVGVTLVAMLVVTSPVREWWERPNRQALHMGYYFDFREGRNPYGPHLDVVPDSAFWHALARRPAGSVHIAVAPFYFESFNWNAPEWERESGQVVIPGYLSGFCVGYRWGEVPTGPRFAFRNAVHLGDARELALRGVDFVVWQRPYVRGVDLIGEDTQDCEATLRERFGTPVYEDAAMIAFATRPLPVATAP